MFRYVILAAYAALPAAGLAAPLLPAFDPALFAPGQPITNPYFPLGPDHQATYVAEGVDAEGPFSERSRHDYAGAGPEILGIGTTVLRDLLFEDGVLVEATSDFYAQDSAGNVWYLGEDVINYRYDDDGNLIGTDNASAWRAGVNGALPGYIIPAVPTLGLAYFQEHAPADGALDQAIVHAVGLTLDVDGRLYSDVIAIFETTELDPDARELKYYAPGVGLIRAEEGVDPEFANPARVFDLALPAPVPLPAGVFGLFGALGLLLGMRRFGRAS